MANDFVRQRYSLGTGGGLTKAASGPATTPKYAKGGKVSAYVVGTNANGARVSGSNSDNKYLKPPKLSFSGRKGDDQFTTITHKGKQVPKGFKVQRP